jgi:hypothetical protein
MRRTFIEGVTYQVAGGFSILPTVAAYKLNRFLPRGAKYVAG